MKYKNQFCRWSGQHWEFSHLFVVHEVCNAMLRRGEKMGYFYGRHTYNRLFLLFSY